MNDCGVVVEPNADLAGDERRPDFVCWKDDSKFYVEVTCIHISTATAKTSIPNGRSPALFSDLNSAIFGESQNKAGQCSNLDAPCLLGVGTFHGPVSMICFRKVHLGMLLTGKQLIGWDVDQRTGQQIGDTYGVTMLQNAAFVRPEFGTLGSARRSISGILACGFGVTPPRVLGLLHPNAVRPFNSELLAPIEFGQLVHDSAKQQLQIEWVRAGLLQTNSRVAIAAGSQPLAGVFDPVGVGPTCVHRFPSPASQRLPRPEDRSWDGSPPRSRSIHARIGTLSKPACPRSGCVATRIRGSTSGYSTSGRVDVHLRMRSPRVSSRGR